MTKEEREEWYQRYDRELAKDFNRFAGKIVDPANPNDPVLEELRKEATMHYSYLRLVPEGEPLTREDAHFTRINAELASAGDGKWKIGNRFTRG